MGSCSINGASTLGKNTALSVSFELKIGGMCGGDGIGAGCGAAGVGFVYGDLIEEPFGEDSTVLTARRQRT
eukprot:6699151-Prymnesium_polylepis.1